ncbi:hypothetical protein ACQPZP_10490 [Spirillospora sp. CA-142024]|uniref:hypothetical protein n=1 Tax=Spirillospora sp. CA-142024 TaxID=3240036 RepID=UPI003D8F49C1
MNTGGSTESGTSESQSAIGRPAGGLPVDKNGNRVYPNDAKTSPAGGQTSGLRTYTSGGGHYYGG